MLVAVEVVGEEGEVGEVGEEGEEAVLVAELARRTRQQKQARSSASTVSGRMAMQVVSCHKLHELCDQLEIMRAYISLHKGLGATAAARYLLYTVGVYVNHVSSPIPKAHNTKTSWSCKRIY